MTETMAAGAYQETMTHQEFLSWCVDLARRSGWRCYYVPDWLHRLAMASIKRHRRGDRDWPDKGFPDLWLAHPSKGVLVFELKVPGDHVKPDQKEWIDWLQMAGIDARVMWPKDRDGIEALLTG